MISFIKFKEYLNSCWSYPHRMITNIGVNFQIKNKINYVLESPKIVIYKFKIYLFSTFIKTSYVENLKQLTKVETFIDLASTELLRKILTSPISHVELLQHQKETLTKLKSYQTLLLVLLVLLQEFLMPNYK